MQAKALASRGRLVALAISMLSGFHLVNALAQENDTQASEVVIAQPALADDLESGKATYYAKRFDGRRTASGETYNMNAFSAAHRTLPFGSYVRVTNLSRRKSVIVRVNDRGPFVKDRVIDLSFAAATMIGLRGAGSARVTLEPVPAAQARAEISGYRQNMAVASSSPSRKHKERHKSGLS